jgi:hypothetical protein
MTPLGYRLQYNCILMVDPALRKSGDGGLERLS